MAVSNTILLELLGKQVSFCWLGADGVTYEIDGQLTSIVFRLESSSEFTVDDGDYFSFDEITEFQVLDDRSIVDAALTGLITGFFVEVRTVAGRGHAERTALNPKGRT